MKVAVLGATGMLGSMLVSYLSKYFQVVATVRNWDYRYDNPNIEWREFDATEPDNLEVTIWDCTWVINAIGALRQRHSDYEDYFMANIYLIRKLDEVADALDISIIQIATDCVFSGKKGNYLETDEHDPIDDYGLSKSKGEIPSSNIVYPRCSIVGLGRNDSYSLLGWFLSQEKDATIEGFMNYKWNGITTLHFAKICRGIIEDDIFINQSHYSRLKKAKAKAHIVPANSVSKYQLLKLFSKYFNRQDIKITPTWLVNNGVDRTLDTVNPKFNHILWEVAGYSKPPTIAQMVKELAEYIKV